MRLINPIVRRWLDEGRTIPRRSGTARRGELPWFRPWDETFVWEPPTFRWFVGRPDQPRLERARSSRRARAAEGTPPSSA